MKDKRDEELTPKERIARARQSNMQIKRMIARGEINHYASFTGERFVRVLEDVIVVIESLLNDESVSVFEGPSGVSKKDSE